MGLLFESATTNRTRLRSAPLSDMRLRREVEILQRGRHPGVEELLSVVEDSEQCTVTTVVPEGPDLGGVSLTISEVAGVLAVAATTLADLHEIGIAHQSLRSDVLILGPDGRPILTGFEAAVLLTGPPRGWPRSDEAAIDVAALAAVAMDLLARATGTGSVKTSASASASGRGPATPDGPKRKRGWVRGSPLVRRRQARRRLAHDPAATMRLALGRAAPGRVTARELAANVVDAVPTAALPPTPAPLGSPEPDHDERIETWLAGTPAPHLRSAASFARPTRGRFFAGVAAVAVLIIIAAAFAGRGLRAPGLRTRDGGTARTVAAARPGPSARPPDARTSAAATDGQASKSPPPAEASPAGVAPSSVSAPGMFPALQGPSDQPPADGSPVDGAPSVDYAAGVLTIGGVRYSVGQPGDLIATGRWLCQPKATVALLRPGTGQVFVFSDWASTQHPATATGVGTVPSARAIRASAIGACDELVVEKATGEAVALHPWREQR